MTIIVPVAITPAGLPLPDPGDRATFSARKLEQLRWANNEYATGSKALADASYANALDTQSTASASSANAASASSSAALAAGYAGSVMWTNKSWAIGEKAYSPIDGRVYRRLTAGSGATDPSADSTNWKIDNNAPLLSKDVSGTSQTGTVGNDYQAVNPAATTLTLPVSPADGDRIAFTPANGRKDNAINSDAVTVRGPSDTAVGLFLLDLGARMELKYSSAITAWVVV